MAPTKRSTSPAFIQPMMAELVTTLPEGAEWLYEVKWDGYRALVFKDGPDIQVRSRNDNDFTTKFAAIADAASNLSAAKVTLDGEIVALGADGRPSFQALQHPSQNGHKLVFYAFDLLQLNGRDLTGRPLAERRQALRRVIQKDYPVIRLSDDLAGSASDVTAALRKVGIEGAIAKRKDSLYQAGKRPGDWVKIKLNQQQELVIGGYRPNGDSVDALLVGFYDGKSLMFAGKVRAGFVPHVRKEVGLILKPLRTNACPFVNLPDARLSRWGAGITEDQMSEMQWVKPSIVAQISFVEWTTDNRLRHAAFLGIRTDKKAKSIHRDR